MNIRRLRQRRHAADDALAIERALRQERAGHKPRCGTCGASTPPPCARARALSRAEAARRQQGASRLGNGLTGNGLIETPGRRLTTGAQLRTLSTTKLGAAPRTPGVNGSWKRVERGQRVGEGAARTGPTTNAAPRVEATLRPALLWGAAGKAAESRRPARKCSSYNKRESPAAPFQLPTSGRRGLGSVVGVRRDRSGDSVCSGGTSVMLGCSLPPSRTAGQT